jgi:2,3-dihydroxybenzoate-AMP ligase
MTRPRQVWPSDFAARYRARGHWRGETLDGMLCDRAASHPDRAAVVFAGGSWSYGELHERAARLASGFRRLGLEPGSRVLVQLPNIPEFLSVVFGLFRANLLPVFVLPAHRRAEVEHFGRASAAAGYVIPDVSGGFDYRTLAREVGPRLPALTSVVVVGDAAEFVALDDLMREAPTDAGVSQPSEVAFLQLSGGSTGFSKLIPRTHDDYLYSVRESSVICGLDHSTVFLATLPIGHNFTMSSPGFLGALYAGGTVALTLSPVPDIAFAAIERHRVTITGLVPPLALVWSEAVSHTKADLSSLRVLQVGGAKLSPELARRIRGLFPWVTLQQVFGMAEGLVNYTRLDDSEDRIVNTQGRPISPDDEVLVVDDQDRPVPDGIPGHLLTRGPYTIRGYYNAPEANVAAFTADGFYRTGDIVQRSTDGYLQVLGRASDMINRGGEKVSPDELEDHLLAHPLVHDVAIVGIPDAYLGEKTCAAVVRRDDTLKPATLKAWVRQRGLAAYKVPDQVVFLDAFPETAVGKTSRREIRARLRERFAADAVARNT